MAATKEFVTRYVQLHPFASTKDEPPGMWMDGVSIYSFASLNDLEDYMASADYALIESAEAGLTDPAACEFWSAVNYSVINRLMPEMVTDRG